MKVFSGTGYGNGTIFVTPGNEHPAEDEFHQRLLAEDGVGTRREPLQIAVKFANGEAEVSEALGRYLLKHKHVSAKPVLIPKTMHERDAAAVKDDGRIVYSKPIEVGRRLPPPGIVDVPEHGLT